MPNHRNRVLLWLAGIAIAITTALLARFGAPPKADEVDKRNPAASESTISPQDGTESRRKFQ